MNDALLVRQEEAVRILTMNNAAMRNAITPAFYTGLLQELVSADADPEVGAIILTGAGDFFVPAVISISWPCAGRWHRLKDDRGWKTCMR